jgi:hypothetical protein
MRFEARAKAGMNYVVVDRVSKGRKRRGTCFIPESFGKRLKEQTPPQRSGGVDRESDCGIAAAAAVTRRRRTAVVDMGDRVHRPRGVPVLDAAGDGGGERGTHARRGA